VDLKDATGSVPLSDGADYFRVEDQPTLKRKVVALYRFWSEEQRGPFCYRWISVLPSGEEEKVRHWVKWFQVWGFKELPLDEVDATPKV
jgi:hypothetical protein